MNALLDIDTAADPSASGTLRVAVLSDLHAFAGHQYEGAQPSFLDIEKPESDGFQHPVTGLIDLIESKRLTADIVVCCGDMGDKAYPAATKYVWEKLTDVIAPALGASLLATAGNHDIDSRHAYNDHDARGLLQELDPLFPIDDEGLADQYWSRHYALVSRSGCRLVLLNSAAYHGEGSDFASVPPEYSCGRIAARTLGRLRKDLQQPPRGQVNILVCHHHPHRFGDIDLADYSSMINGEALISLLDSDASPWMIIHGHKHFPHMEYAAGSATSPIVFAAGSFSAMLTGELVTRARNQFYVLEFPYDTYAALGLPLAGRLRAWDWHIGGGWEEAGSDSGLPHLAGFGCRDAPRMAATAVESLVRGSSGTIEWTAVLAAYPRYEYLLPGDRRKVLNHLTEAGIKVQSAAGYPLQLST